MIKNILLAGVISTSLLFFGGCSTSSNSYIDDLSFQDYPTGLNIITNTDGTIVTDLITFAEVNCFDNNVKQKGVGFEKINFTTKEYVKSFTPARSHGRSATKTSDNIEHGYRIKGKTCVSKTGQLLVDFKQQIKKFGGMKETQMNDKVIYLPTMTQHSTNTSILLSPNKLTPVNSATSFYWKKSED
jgi:hypothetical protein